ncbi:hypothetical protein QUF72_12390 [Desulfobacterales bacterium HSG2]|nr:hypothetical protein [Desulfobacterales bacterium HSG2]
MVFGEAREYDNGFQDETDIPGSDMTADSGDETDISVSSSYPLSYSRASQNPL